MCELAMISDSELEYQLRDILNRHKERDSLLEQTPRMLREQLSIALNVPVSDLDPFKERVKTCIQSFLNDNKNSPLSQLHSESSSVNTAELRSIAKMVGVPPMFWSNLDKASASSIRMRLAEFCKTKQVEMGSDVPTMKEAKKYKKQREAAAELEGINSSNIVTSKRKRFQDFLM